MRQLDLGAAFIRHQVRVSNVEIAVVGPNAVLEPRKLQSTKRIQKFHSFTTASRVDHNSLHWVPFGRFNEYKELDRQYITTGYNANLVTVRESLLYHVAATGIIVGGYDNSSHRRRHTLILARHQTALSNLRRITGRTSVSEAQLGSSAFHARE